MPRLRAFFLHAHARILLTTSTSAITSASIFTIIVVFIRFLFVMGLVLLVIASVDRRDAGGCVLTRLIKRLLLVFLVRLFDIRALTHATAFVLGRLLCISNTFALIVGGCLIRFFVHSSIVSLRSETLRYTNLRASFVNSLFSWSL